MIDLTISIRDHPEAPEHVFRLVSKDGHPDAGTTMPEPAAALAAVEAGIEIHAIKGVGYLLQARP